MNSSSRLTTAVAVLAVAFAAGCSPDQTGDVFGVPENRSPIARDDAFTVAHRGEAVLSLTANDEDPEGFHLWVVSVTNPLHGALHYDTWVESYVYEAPAGFAGEDSFRYTVRDQMGAEASANVRITVEPNSAPTAGAPQWAYTYEDAPATLALSGADVEDIPAQLRVEVVVPPVFGTLAPASGPATLVATYTPSANWSGTDSFSFRVVDSEGAASEPVTATVEVWPVNDAPVAAAVEPLALDEDGSVAVTLTGSDPETAATGLEVIVYQYPAHGAVSGSGSTWYSLAPYQLTYAPFANYAGPDSFVYRVRDPEGALSPPVTVTVTVRQVNDAPVATPRSVAATEDVPVAMQLTGTDLESQAGALAVEVLTQPARGTLSALSGAAPLGVTFTPARDYLGPDSFTFRVVDPAGVPSEPATVSIAVAAVNDPPSATTVAPVVTNEDVPVAVELTGADPDDAVTSLVAVVTAAPAHGTLSASSGTAPLAITYTPAPGWSGADAFAFKVRDLAGALSAPSTVAVTVNPVQDGPVAGDDDAIVCAGGSVRIRVLLNDGDPDGDPLAVAAVTQGALGAVAIDGDAVVYASNGTAGPDVFTYTAMDGGRTATAAVSVTVSDPTVLSVLPASGTTGGPLQLAGRCFGATPGTVTIGGRAADVTTWTARYVVATVPTDFAPGTYEVLVSPPGAPPAATIYEIVPWIGHVEPYYAAPGEAQSVLGDAFVTPAGTVAYGGVIASVDGWTNTVIQSRMPGEGRWSLVATTSGGATTNPYPVTAAGPDTWWTARVPAGRSDHTAVWTGTELVVFGGARGSGLLLKDGGRYDPRHDAWVPVAKMGEARARHTAVWTGTEMIVWGGATGSYVQTSTGVRYRPGPDVWAPTSVSGAPQAREQHSAIWTGSRMIVWGGLNYIASRNDGASYDPVSDSWTPLSTSGAPSSRYAHAAVWTGKEMIVWGGLGGGARGDGARYDPATDRWRPMSSVGAPSPRGNMAAVWTGEELIVWGGSAVSGAYLADGARYDPVADEWRPLTSDGAPAARAHAPAVWTGKELVVWGGRGGGTSGGRYDPAGDRWAAMDASTDARDGHTAVWTGAELIVWGGSGGLDTGARWSPVADAWTPTRSGAPGEPAPRRDHAWACLPGGDLVVWGGSAAGKGDVADGARYHASTGTWSPLATAGAPSPREQATAVWTGTHLLVWGGKRVEGSTTAYLADGARYDPAADEWTAMATSDAPAARSGHTATWAGGRMVVFGGRNGTKAFGDGGVYDPATDTWVPLATLNAPTARLLHTAVGAGDEVIVWGGETFAAGRLSTGARYDVASDVWRVLPTSAAPTQRSRHAAVWTGDQMFVFGGSAGGSGYYDGARYIPRLDAWGAVANVPYGVYGHSAVWTGTQLIAWGGSTPLGPFRWSRTPSASGTWTTSAATSAAPPVRDAPSMCWTGTDVVVWGGASGSTATGALGRYRP